MWNSANSLLYHDCCKSDVSKSRGPGCLAAPAVSSKVRRYD
jgi:hypothetical protein